MPLARFILSNLDALLRDWDAFARTIPPASDLSRKQVRNHAERLLREIAADIRTAQSATEQAAKSRGELQPAPVDDVAAEHADERHQQGFDLCQMVAEYRALRATVTRQWTNALTRVGPDELRDLIRFNEVLDQAIARFMHDLDGSRELLLGMLGHDLRTPLSAILQSATYLKQSGNLSPQHERAAIIIGTSAARIGALANNLLEMARIRLGGRLPIAQRRGSE
jgi:signal transduction histidine kinase